MVRDFALLGPQALVDFFAVGADRELVGISTWHPLLPAQRSNWLPGHCRLEDFLFLDVVRESIMVARINGLFLKKLFEFAVESRSASAVGRSARIRNACFVHPSILNSARVKCRLCRHL